MIAYLSLAVVDFLFLHIGVNDKVGTIECILEVVHAHVGKHGVMQSAHCE